MTDFNHTSSLDQGGFKNTVRTSTEKLDRETKAKQQITDIMEKTPGLDRSALAAYMDASFSVKHDDPLNPPQLRSTFVPPPFESIAKALTMQDVDSRTRYAADRVKEFRARKRTLEQEQVINNDRLAALDKMMEWSEGPFRIEKPSGSLFHKLKECWLAKDTLSDDPGLAEPFFSGDPNIFIIEHDWAKAFSGASDFDGGEWPLPYDLCVFEFQISGKRIIVLSMLAEGRGIISAIAMHIGGSYWSISKFGDMSLPPSGLDEIGDRDKLYPINLILHQNVRALCIALDAEVAVTSVTRAPHRLNSIRERQGKPLLADFHTVDLAKRSRIEALPSDGEHEPRWKVRLHFRRGHWRHFQKHKTWIKWMLVGSPDLGFIDKHYRA